jgi:hypothetical protein
MAGWLIWTRPINKLMNIDDKGLERMAWYYLNQLDLGLGCKLVTPDVIY